MTKELKILNDIYTLPDHRGRQRIVKKNVVTRMLINTQDIRYVEEVVNKEGKILPGVCMIKVEGETFKIKHSFDEIKELVRHVDGSSDIKIGFKIPKIDGRKRKAVREPNVRQTEYSEPEASFTRGSSVVLFPSIQGDGAEV